jgi:hypothetical protein
MNDIECVIFENLNYMGMKEIWITKLNPIPNLKWSNEHKQNEFPSRVKSNHNW